MALGLAAGKLPTGAIHIDTVTIGYPDAASL